MTRSENKMFSILMIIGTASFVSTDIYLPSLPAIRTQFQVSNDWVQLSISLYLLALSIAQLLYGPISDRWGRRRIVLWAFGLSLIGTLMAITSFNLPMLIAGRIVQAIGLGAGSVVSRAAMRDLYSGDKLAHFGALFSMGTCAVLALAPIIGGYIQNHLGWRHNFGFIFLYTLVGMGSVLICMPETNKNLDRSATRIKQVFKNYVRLIKHPAFLGYSLCSALALAGLIGYYTSSPFVLQDSVGLSPTAYGWTALFVATGIGLGSLLNRAMVLKKGKTFMLDLGILIQLLSGLTMLGFGLMGIINVWVFVAPMVIFSSGSALVFATAFAGAFHPFPKMAGAVGSVYSAIQVLGGSFGGNVIAFFHENNQIPTASLLIFASLVSFLMHAMAKKSAL